MQVLCVVAALVILTHRHGVCYFCMSKCTGKQSTYVYIDMYVRKETELSQKMRNTGIFQLCCSQGQKGKKKPIMASESYRH